MVSGVTASCKIKQVSFFFLSICLVFFLQQIEEQPDENAPIPEVI